MGLFDSIFRPNKNKEQEKALEESKVLFKTLTAYQPVFRNWQGSIYESELIRSAIGARSRHISKLKFEVTGSAKKGLTSRLLQSPNSWQTWPQFLARVSTILDIHNTAFIVPVHDENMSTIGIFPVLPSVCEVVEYKEEAWIRYKFSNGNTGAVKASECAVLTQYQYKNDFFGESNTALNPTLKLVNLNNQGLEEAIRNGATFRFWGRMSNFAKAEDIAKERKRFDEENFKGESGGMLLFPSNYADIHQYNQSPFTVDPAQMEQIRTNVYNYFGVNEDVLQNKAFGDSWSAFYEGCVEVFAVAFSEALTKALFTEREIATGNKIALTSNRLQYLSNSDKLNVSSQMADRGIMTRNEIREIWNLPPIEGGDVATIRGEYYMVNEEGVKTDEGK